MGWYHLGEGDLPGSVTWLSHIFVYSHCTELLGQRWPRDMPTCSFQACSLEKVMLGSACRTSPPSLAQWQRVARELQCSEWTSLIDTILSWDFFWSSIFFFLHTSSEWHVDKFLKLWVFPWEGFHHLTYLTNLLVTIITQNGTNFSIIKNCVSIIHWAFN